MKPPKPATGPDANAVIETAAKLSFAAAAIIVLLLLCGCSATGSTIRVPYSAPRESRIWPIYSDQAPNQRLVVSRYPCGWE